MKKPRTLRFAAAGAFIALLLAVAGRRIDAAVPAIHLDQQVFYNWLALLLSPASFLLRSTNPDGPIVPSVSFAAVTIALNALWYATAHHVYLLVARPANAMVSATEPAWIAIPGSSNSSSPRRSSPSERLADRYEHRLSAQQTDAIIDDSNSAVLSESNRR